jgi:hypothetical protein
MSEYETDILQWSEHQSALLRRRAAGELVNETDMDWANIAEEIESVGSSQRLALASQVRRIIEHLAKLETSPTQEPRRGWIATILEARAQIESLLEDSPSLKTKLDDTVHREHPRALRIAAASIDSFNEAPKTAIEDLSYSAAQILGPWLPG